MLRECAGMAGFGRGGICQAGLPGGVFCFVVGVRECAFFYLMFGLHLYLGFYLSLGLYLDLGFYLALSFHLSVALHLALGIHLVLSLYLHLYPTTLALTSSFAFVLTMFFTSLEEFPFPYPHPYPHSPLPSLVYAIKGPRL
jgi:hypothetical protein